MASESTSANSFSWLVVTGLLAVLVIGGAGAGAYFLWGPDSTQSNPDPEPDPKPEPARPQGPVLFKDITRSSGVQVTFKNGQEAGFYAILESLGGGVALIDYDGDGLLDLFVTTGGYYKGKQPQGYPCRLYRNKGNWQFEDVTDKVFKDPPLFYTHGAAVADYDRDGWPDLLVTGWGRVALYHNEPVDPNDPSRGRRFREVSREAGLIHCDWTTSAAWADLNGDGYPDLYLCQYVDWSPDHNPKCPGYTGDIGRDVCPPKTFNGRDHILYRNNGNGTFTNITREAGLNILGKKDAGGKQVQVGKGLGVIITDFDNDGKPDIYVANDTVENFLYMNRTRRHFFGTRLKLVEVGGETGTAVDDNAVPNGSMGVTAGDFDRSDFASIFVTNYEGENHALYRNDKGSFGFYTQAAGIAAIGQDFVGFGTWFVDLENRGWLDLVIINGHVIRFPVRAGLRQRPILFSNQQAQEVNGSRQFQEISPRGGTYFQTNHMGRGLAVGDLNNRGLSDLVVSHLNDPVAVLRNVSDQRARPNHWLGIELVGEKFRDVIGTRITLEVNGTRRTAFAVGGGSYLSACDQRHIFGLGKTTHIDRITVAWPWGMTQVWEGKQFQVDRYWRLVEHQGPAEKWTGRAEYLKSRR
jgi:hypothetical protein